MSSTSTIRRSTPIDMRSSINRSKKYKAKLDGSVNNRRLAAYGSTQKGQFRQAVGRQVKIEKKVKSILEVQGVMPALNHFYMNFGKKLDRIKATYHGGPMWDEACIEYGKWELRGLDKDILDLIVCNIMVSPCNPCPPGGGLPWTGEVTVYYAGCDGDYQKGLTLDRPIVKGAGSSRFTDNGDGTVTDNATGLMWVANPAGLGAPFNAKIAWASAIDACEALNFAGYDDWRLPNIKEIFTLFDMGFAQPAIDAFFFTVQANDTYWSSTTLTGYVGYAYRVNSRFAEISTSMKTTAYWAFPVRGGQP